MYVIAVALNVVALCMLCSRCVVTVYLLFRALLSAVCVYLVLLCMCVFSLWLLCVFCGVVLTFSCYATMCVYFVWFLGVCECMLSHCNYLCMFSFTDRACVFA